MIYVERLSWPEHKNAEEICPRFECDQQGKDPVAVSEKTLDMVPQSLVRKATKDGKSWSPYKRERHR